MIATLLLSAYGCAGGGDAPNAPTADAATVAVAELSGTALDLEAKDKPSRLTNGNPRTWTPPTTEPAPAPEPTPTPTPTPTPEPVPTTPTTGVKSVTLAATDAEFQNNPERGYAGWAGDLAVVWPGGLQNEVAAGRALMRAQVNLENFLYQDLSADFLSRLEQGFAEVRNAGGKIILRFLYNSPAVGFTGIAQDAGIEQVLRHIAQLAPVLQRNADTISYVEGGFIGAWGEWHSSTSGLTSDTNKARIRDALLQAVPADRMILIRSPGDVQRWFGTPVTAGEAFNGTPRARIGFHNDCFMSGPTDAGTYPSTSVRDFAMETVKSTPFGAETCDVGQTLRNACTDILREGRQYALSYLNHYGHQSAFKPRWDAEGCSAEVARSFGYRLRLASATHDAEVVKGSAFSIKLAVRNVGWARLYNARPLKVRLVHRSLGTIIETTATGIDPRQWRPLLATELSTESVGSVVVPATAPIGEYDVWIGLPDASARLATDRRYAIRFANADNTSTGQRWDAVTARFALGTTLLVR